MNPNYRPVFDRVTGTRQVASEVACGAGEAGGDGIGAGIPAGPGGRTRV